MIGGTFGGNGRKTPDWDQRGGFNLFLLVRWQLQEKLRTLYYKALAGVIESYNLV